MIEPGREERDKILGKHAVTLGCQCDRQVEGSRYGWKC